MTVIEFRSWVLSILPEAVVGLRWPWHPCWHLGRSHLFLLVQELCGPCPPGADLRAPRAALLQELEVVVEALDVGHHPTCLVFWDGWDPGLGMGAGSPFEGGGVCSCSPVDSPQVIQPPPKPGALIRPPQVTLTQTPMVALRQPHNRIVLTTPQQIQLNQLQPGERLTLSAWSSSPWDSQLKLGYFTWPVSAVSPGPHPGSMVFRGLDSLPAVILRPQKV